MFEIQYPEKRRRPSSADVEDFLDDKLHLLQAYDRPLN
jgi:hypothetical protein